jgi:hypothetical protein
MSCGQLITILPVNMPGIGLFHREASSASGVPGHPLQLGLAASFKPNRPVVLDPRLRSFL